MVNTVGSHANRHWNKKWISVKQTAFLSHKQKSFIVGSLLGDATMRIGRGAQNANFKVGQGLEQKDYVLWKYEILKPLVFTEPKISYRYRENGERYEKSWWFRTIRHQFLTEIYRNFYSTDGYKTGKKIVPKNIASELNPFALAIWIMDDGSYNSGVIDISTYSFSLSEIHLLRNVFEEVFSIKAQYYKDRDKGFRMYFSKRETEKLIPIICPFIIPSMKYKIGLRDPVTTGVFPII